MDHGLHSRWMLLHSIAARDSRMQSGGRELSVALRHRIPLRVVNGSVRARWNRRGHLHAPVCLSRHESVLVISVALLLLLMVRRGDGAGRITRSSRVEPIVVLVLIGSVAPASAYSCCACLACPVSEVVLSGQHLQQGGAAGLSFRSTRMAAIVPQTCPRVFPGPTTGFRAGGGRHEGTGFRTAA